MKSQTMTSETKTDASYRILGKTQFKQGDIEAARQSYRQAIELNPKQPTWVYQHLANIFKQKKQIEEAIKMYQFAIKLQSENSSFYRNLAKLQAQMGNMELAIANYRKAIEIKSEQPSWVYQNLGSALYEKKYTNESIAIYKKGLELESENPILYRGIAKCQALQGDIERAIVSYRKAVELDPQQPSWVYNNIVNLLKKQGNSNEASQVYFKLGQAFAKKRNWNKAITYYQASIKIKPDFFQVYLYLGDVFRYQKKIDQSISYYLKTIQIEPEFREPYARLITFLEKTNIPSDKLDEICKITQQIISENYNHNLLYQCLSNALSLQGNLKKAIGYNYRLAQKNNLNSNLEFIHENCDVNNLNMPNFLIVGFAKCGTTSLYNYIIKHPKVLAAGRKEINFFNNEKLFNLGINWYKSNFLSIPDGTEYITGEATPTYVLNSIGMKRIKNISPNIKLIVILRNPVDRAISQHFFGIKRGEQYRSLETAIGSAIKTIQNIQNNKDNLEEQIEQYHGYIPNAGILSASLYFYFIKKLIQLFSREQLLILKTEDLGKNPVNMMNKVFEFLELPNYQLSEYPRENSNSYSGIDENLRQKLSNFFQPYNKKLEQLTGIECNWK